MRISEILIWFGAWIFFVLGVGASAYNPKKKDVGDSLGIGFLLSIPTFLVAIGFRLLVF